MRLGLLPFFLAAGFAAGQASQSGAEPKSRLEGRILSTTGEPVKKATVRLENDSVSYFDTSDNEGKFLFENIQPGSYTLVARRTGFVGQRETTPYVLAPGQVVKDVVMKLPKQAVISGRVVDEDGDPIPDAEVEAFRWSYIGGKRLLSRSGGTATNNQGGFLITGPGLSPGRYYLLVVDQPGNRPRGIPGRLGPRRGYVSTFYPTELEAANTVPLDVAAGAEVQGITIQVRSERIYSIRGKVTGLPAKELAKYYDVRILRVDDSTAPGWQLPIVIQIRPADGTFESPYLAPGTYSLEAASEANGALNNDRVPVVARLEVTIRDADVDGIVMELHPAVRIEISGIVKVEGGPAGAGDLGRSPVAIRQLDGLSNYDGAIEPKEDGTFRFGGLGPARYQIGLFATPAGMYLKSIRLGNQDLMHTPLDLTSGAGGAIEILLGRNPADVNGTVHLGDDKSRGTTVVAIWPVTPQPGVLREGITSVNAGRRGEFQFKGLAPGEYYLTAWEEEPGLGLVDSPDFRARVQREASKITSQEGSHETIELKLLPQDEITAEAAKLR
jgi:hypothetical protein